MDPQTRQLMREYQPQERGRYRTPKEYIPKRTPQTTLQLLAMTAHSGKHIGAELVESNGALSWAELMTDDIDEAKTFYDSVLGVSSHDVQMTPGINGDSETVKIVS